MWMSIQCSVCRLDLVYAHTNPSFPCTPASQQNLLQHGSILTDTVMDFLTASGRVLSGLGGRAAGVMLTVKSR